MGKGLSDELRTELFSLFVLGSATLALVISFYTHLYTQAYTFLVEAPCDATSAVCYVRDCDEEECPPNGLSEYRVYALTARAFATCADNSCSNICTSTSVCKELQCSEDADDTCSVMEDNRYLENTP